MNKLKHELRKRWLRLIGKKTTELDGVVLSTSSSDVHKFVQSLLFRGTYEDSERDLIKSILGPKNRVLEIGCGIGFISILARKICTHGHVRSYEANPKMEALIRKNYALNNLEPDLIMKAVTVDGSDVEFFVDDGIISSSTIDRGRDHTKTIVNSDALDTVLNDFKPDTLIMDVEGAEIGLLGQSSLSGVKNIVVEMHPHIVGSEKIQNLIDNLEKKNFFVKKRQGKAYLLKFHEG